MKNEAHIDEIIFLRSIDSTNSFCLQEAASLRSGTIVTADVQTSGRGRHGRQWYSPDGINLYASILLKRPPAQVDFAWLPQISCLCISRSLSRYGVKDVWIKWPNDVYVGPAKIAGVLSEFTSMDHNITAAVVGLGVNLNLDETSLITIDKPATSIFIETRQWVSRDEFLHLLVNEFNELCNEARHSGGDSVYQAWKANSKLIGQWIQFHAGNDRWLQGKVIDFERDGSIVIQTSDEKKHRFTSGDVSLCLPR